MDEANETFPLKVLMTADTVGGVWTYAMELCRVLSGSQVHFHLVTLGAPMQAWQKAEVRELGNVTVYETEYKLEWMENPWDDLEESGAYLLELQRVIQADLIHLNGYAYGALDWDAPVVMVAHSDVYSWFRAVKGENPPAEWETYFNKIKAGLREANHIVAPSEAMLTELNAIYSLRKNHSVIYNARTSDHFYAGQKEKTVMCVGRIWDEAKNVQLLMDAAAGICCNIKIAGQRAFEHNNIEVNDSNVLHLGKLSAARIAEELSTASVYALPAKYEPFGLSVLEAALSGCALVLGDIPSLREIWGEHATYVNTSNPAALTAAVNTLMQDEQLLHAMAQKAQQRARHFSTQKMGKQYLKLYNQLITQNEPVPGKTL